MVDSLSELGHSLTLDAKYAADTTAHMNAIEISPQMNNPGSGAVPSKTPS
jgi:hypothetical protein